MVQVPLLDMKRFNLLLAGASCFLLERHWNAATSPMFKTPIYMILGATLSFTVSQLGQKSS